MRFMVDAGQVVPDYHAGSFALIDIVLNRDDGVIFMKNEDFR